MPRKAFGIGIPRLPVGRTWLIGEVQQTRTLVINQWVGPLSLDELDVPKARRREAVMEVPEATIGLTRSITFGTAASVARIPESSGTSSSMSSLR